MSNIFPTLNKNQQQYLAELAAGKRQVTVLQSLLGNWESVEEAVKNAADSTGSATIENEKFLNSIQGKLNQVKSEWQLFAKQTINSEMVKDVIDLAGGILKIVRYLGGIPPILGTIFGIITMIKSQAIGVSISAFIFKLQGLNVGLDNTSVKSTTAGMTVSGMGKHFQATAIETTALSSAMSALAFGIGAVISAFSIGISIASIWAQSTAKTAQEAEESTNKILSQVEAINDLKDTYSELISKTSLTSSETETLNKTIEDLSKKYNISSEALKGDNAERKNAIKQINEEIAQRKLLAAETSKGQLGTKTLFGKGAVSGEETFTRTEGFGFDYKKGGENVSFESMTMSGLLEQYEKYIEEKSQINDLSKDEQKILKKVKEDYIQLSSEVEVGKNVYQNYLDALKAGADVKDKDIQGIINVGLATKEEIEQLKWLNNAEKNLTETSKNWGVSEDAAQELINIAREKGIESFENYLDKYQEIQKEIDEGNITSTEGYLQLSVGAQEYADTINNLETALQDLNSLQDDMNEYGSIQADTLENLISNHADWLQYLEIENGELIISADNLALINQLEAQNAAINLGNKFIETAGGASTLAGETSSLAAQYASATDSGAKFAIVQKMIKSLLEGGMNADQAIAEVNKITSVMDNLLNKTYTAPKYSGGGSSKKSSGSSSKSTKDTWKEAFEEQYDALKHQLTMEEITEQQYVDRLDDLYKYYFSDKSKYLDEYRKYEEEVYKKRKNLMEDEIDELQKVLKAQRKVSEDKYENAIKVATNVLDKKIEALQKEKEALEDSNDEQERAMKLAELQENLERAKTQKTRRVFYADRRLGVRI